MAQALEAAIELGLPKVEAGAQGEHKISRGYLPSPTYSSHYIVDPTFRSMVSLTNSTAIETKGTKEATGILRSWYCSMQWIHRVVEAAPWCHGR